MHISIYNFPLTPSHLNLSNRRSLIIRTSRGYGEAAPLPSLSSENIHDAYTCLQNSTSCPSADFARDSANLDFPHSFPVIPICALATNRQEAEEAIRKKFQIVKLKVKNVLEAIELVSSLQSRIQLRIDVNRKWNIQEAQYFFQSIDPTHIEYIEEPTYDLTHIEQLTTLPIAFDESLSETLLHLPNLTTFILKPTILGRRLNDWIQLGRKYRKNLVFSSSFESAIGLLHIAHLQARWAPNVAVGLDTHRFFQNNFFPMTIKNGMLCDDPIPSNLSLAY